MKTVWTGLNRNYNYISGILAYDVSDHLPTFFFLKNLPTCGNDLVVLNNIYRRCFPISTKFVSGKRLQKPWLTRGILNSIKEKSKLYRKF